MTWLPGSRVKRADLLIAAIQEGNVLTCGQLRSWIDSAASLPPRLREYVFERIEPSIGPNGVSYLRSLLPAPVTKVLP
jgi:hypothetical protein